jgi:hypothetical protein
MDPTEALTELRMRIEMAKMSLDGNLEAPIEGGSDDNFSRIVDLFQGLDHWLDLGGVLPQQWQKTRINGW